MSLLKQIESDIKEIIEKLGYDIEKATLTPSNRKDLGEFQCNDAMFLANKYQKPSRDIASEISLELSKNSDYVNVNIAGPGFINISVSNTLLTSYMRELENDLNNAIDMHEKKKIIIDYGGANVAKALHVGHLRAANIGEALKRLATTLGYEMIGDVHLGDQGRQSGMCILEIKERYPNLPYFDTNFSGEYPSESPISGEELESIYPIASKKAKESEEYLDEVRKITGELQNGNKGYEALWNHIKNTSIKEIRKIYESLNANFELWEGETDSYKYIPVMMEEFKEKGLIYEDNGAIIMDVKEDTDEKEIPPIILKTSNEAYTYATTDLATIYGRMKRFNPDGIWYVVDIRQELHFMQVFRGAKKAGLIPQDYDIHHYGFGTMNGSDGKPFKTRDGGVMRLLDLLSLVKEETSSRLNSAIVDSKEREEIANTLAIAAIKYADLIPNRTTDYVFDPTKFSDLEGKTGPYLLYSTVRMKSLLNKAKANKELIGPITKISGNADRDIMIMLLNLGNTLEKAFTAKSLNEITDYIYKLANTYNKFYSENKILIEPDDEQRSSWLGLTKLAYEVNIKLLTILGIDVPEKM